MDILEVRTFYFDNILCYFDCDVQERIERMKREGTYMTKAQKEAKARADAMLEAMKQQGIEVPSKTPEETNKTKRVRYGTRTKKNKKDQNQGEIENN